MRGVVVWLLDALIIGVGAGALYWLLWGGTLGGIAFYGAFAGVSGATYFRWSREPTLGRRLVDYCAKPSYY